MAGIILGDKEIPFNDFLKNITYSICL